MRVFLGSTFADLQVHRLRTIDALRALSVHVDAMELWLAKPEDPLTVCLDLVRKCDIYLCVVAHRYGSQTAGGKSFTQMEYELAMACGKACLVFLMGDEHAVIPRFVDKGETAAKLDSFRGILRAHHLTTTFGDAEDLAHRVVESVRRLMQDCGVKGAAGVDLSTFWHDLSRQWAGLDPAELRVEFEPNADPLDLLEKLGEELGGIEKFHKVVTDSYSRLESDLRDTIERIGCDPTALDEVPYYENRFVGRDWEWITFFPNRLRRCEVLLAQVRVQWLENLSATNQWSPRHDPMLAAAKRALENALARGMLID